MFIGILSPGLMSPTENPPDMAEGLTGRPGFCCQFPGGRGGPDAACIRVGTADGCGVDVDGYLDCSYNLLFHQATFALERAMSTVSYFDRFGSLSVDRLVPYSSISTGTNWGRTSGIHGMIVIGEKFQQLLETS